MTGGPGPQTARCSEISQTAGESLAGTAPETPAWLLVEQGLPWGRDALVESGVDRSVALELSRRAEAAGVKVLLVRRAGRRSSTERERRVFAAWTGQKPFLDSLTCEGDLGLLDLDLEGLARGARPDGGTPVDGSMTVVCTNGRRDACCALHGCRAVDALVEVRPEATWECSHLGGHRFAATMLCLPSGACFGRLRAASAVETVVALEAGTLDLNHLRGFVGRPAPVQVAEDILRRRLGLVGLRDVTPAALRQHDDTAEVTLRTAGSHAHSIVLQLVYTGMRAVSCAGASEEMATWREVR